MALMKAFVCQLVLFGLYKLFLEQVVVDHLVPDELTRNCLVGFVIFMCFGIQLYTDKAEDDLAENGEDLKTKSNPRESIAAKKLESTPVANETDTKSVGLETSSYLLNTKRQISPQEMSKEKQHSGIQQVIDLKKENIALPSAQGVIKNSHPGMFAEFSSNVPDKIGSAVKTSYESETKTFPVLNGFSEINISQESEEDGIEIDQFVCKESCKAAEKLTTVDTDVCTTEPKHATDSVNVSEKLTSSVVNITSTEGFDLIIDEPEQLITIKSEEAHTIKLENVTEIVMDSEKMISNGLKNSSKQDLNPDQTIDELEQLMEVESINELLAEAVVEPEYSASNGMKISSKPDLDSKPVNNEYESQFINATVMESSNIIDEMSSNINKKNEINSTKNGTEVGDGNHIISTDASETGTCSTDITKSLPSVQDIASTSTVSIKTVNKERTMIENNVETSPAVNKTVPSTRRKISSSENVNVSYYPVDISFIYACH